MKLRQNEDYSDVWGKMANRLISNVKYKDAVVSTYRRLIRKKEEYHGWLNYNFQHRRVLYVAEFRRERMDLVGVISLVEHDGEG